MRRGAPLVRQPGLCRVDPVALRLRSRRVHCFRLLGRISVVPGWQIEGEIAVARRAMACSHLEGFQRPALGDTEPRHTPLMPSEPNGDRIVNGYRFLGRFCTPKQAGSVMKRMGGDRSQPAAAPNGWAIRHHRVGAATGRARTISSVRLSVKGSLSDDRCALSRCRQRRTLLTGQHLQLAAEDVMALNERSVPQACVACHEHGTS